MANQRRHGCELRKDIAVTVDGSAACLVVLCSMRRVHSQHQVTGKTIGEGFGRGGDRGCAQPASCDAVDWANLTVKRNNGVRKMSEPLQDGERPTPWWRVKDKTSWVLG